MTHVSAPIGVFDSGVGGLPIARAIRTLLPHEHLLYVADSRYAPYGAKTDEAILARCLAVSDFLVAQQAKAIVVACNTATTTCIAALRARYQVPIIGVEPGVKPAVLNTRSGVIGVLATPKTLVTDSFTALAHKVAGNVRVEVMACPDLVAQVESLQLSPAVATEVVAKYVRPLLKKGADTIVLGCTHYVHLKQVIIDMAGPSVQVISTEDAVAREVQRRLSAENLLNDCSAVDPVTAANSFWTNSDTSHFQRQIDVLWGAGETVRPFSDGCSGNGIVQ